MRYEGGSVRRLALPVKGWVQRFAFVLFIAAAIGLMILGKAESRLVERLRVTITDVTAPVLEVLSHPAAAFAAATEEMRQLIDLRSENTRLRAENAALKKSVSTDLRLKVSEKGGLSVYGLGRFPVTLYKEQWVKLLGMADDIRSFIEMNDKELKSKN